MRWSSKVQAAVIAVIVIVTAVASVTYYLSFPSSTPAPTSTSTLIATEDSEWRLLIDEFVQHPLNLNLREIIAMPNSNGER